MVVCMVRWGVCVCGSVCMEGEEGRQMEDDCNLQKYFFFHIWGTVCMLQDSRCGYTKPNLLS